jgi:hypothetical protein
MLQKSDHNKYGAFGGRGIQVKMFSAPLPFSLQGRMIFAGCVSHMGHRAKQISRNKMMYNLQLKAQDPFFVASTMNKRIQGTKESISPFPECAM